MTKRILLLAICSALVLASASRAQNRFEGYNVILDVPTTQRSAACALRYAPAASAVTVTDLDRSTPMNIRPCTGSTTTVQQGSSATATVKANPTTYQWCFMGE